MNDVRAREIFDRFSDRLMALARRNLDRSSRQKVDPDDVVQSALGSFFRRRSAGEFEIDDWDDLWRLLVVMTLRKCSRKKRSLRAARRDLRRETRLSDLRGETGEQWQVSDREPRPEEVAALIETVEELLAGANDVERRIILMRLEGYTHQEISEHIDHISERKVYRVIAQARNRVTGEITS